MSQWVDEVGCGKVGISWVVCSSEVELKCQEKAQGVLL